MEQARILMAIVLSFLVFILWDQLFVPKNTSQNSDKKIEVQEDKSVPYVDSKQHLIADAVKTEQKVIQSDERFKTIVVTTPLYSVNISEKGGVFEKFELKEYKKTIDADSPYFEVISPKEENRNIRIKFAENSIHGLENAVFKCQNTTTNVEVYEHPQEIIFSWMSPKGILIQKAYTFYPDTYKIELKVAVKNGTLNRIKDSLLLSVVKYLPPGSGSYGFEGPCALINNKLEQVKTGNIEDKNVYSGKIKWLAVHDRYFISGIIPQQEQETSIRLFVNENNTVENQYVEPVNIESKTQQTFRYNIFFGPRSMEILSKVGYDLDKAVDFGWFDFIAKPCVWIMNWIYKYIPNYGVAIILLTLFTKIILWPLGNKSYKSMADMKKIQPLVSKLREQYKDDKKKMNQETMALYRTYKVNPMGGCLPMVLQIPIFFALYRMLYESIELRHAPFFGWIQDLSAPDRLFNFNFSIPFMDPPYGIPVLTIIMGATMFLQQKMSPPMGDSTQAKMMMLMPIVFTVIFINFSSGLVLYWLINNILSIAQQYYVTKNQA